MDFSTLDKMLAKVNKVQPLNGLATAKLRESLNIEMVYNSNAIEGSTITLRETHLIVNEGITIDGKSWKEHLEVSNLFQAVTFAQEIVSEKVELDEQLVKQLHQIVMSATPGIQSGKYRNIEVRISGSKHVPVNSLEVPLAMRNLFEWLRIDGSSLHPVELAARVHHDIAYIHPFEDGNGRTSRLCMNFILMQNGFPPIIVKGDYDSRMKYYDALEKASAYRDYEDFIQIIYDLCEEMLDIYIKTLTPNDWE